MNNEHNYISAMKGYKCADIYVHGLLLSSVELRGTSCEATQELPKQYSNPFGPAEYNSGGRLPLPTLKF
jgi:hypothetical protein